MTFSVGGITLCSEPAQPFMTPLSCAQTTDPSANTSTPSVVALTQFLMSINTTATPSQSSPSTITITSSELQAAKNLTLDFATATQTDLQNAVSAIDPGAMLVTPAAAQTEITGTVDTAFAGNYAGTFSGSVSGTWTAKAASNGNVSGTATQSNGTVGALSGSFVSGTTFSGTVFSSSWTGTLDTSKNPAVFSGTWTVTAQGLSGTFTGTEQ